MPKKSVAADRADRCTKAVTLMREAHGILDDLKNEVEEAYENTPDSLKGGDRGERLETAKDALDSACDNLDEDIDALEGLEF